MANSWYESTYCTSIYGTIEAKMQNEIKVLATEFGFDRNTLNNIRKFYVYENGKCGDVLKNINLMLFILNTIGFGESEEERFAFVRTNLRLFLDANSNFMIKLSILSHFDLLKDAIRENYLLRLRLPIRFLYALLSSNVKFDSILELDEIYDRMSLEEREVLLVVHHLSGDIQNVLYREMMRKMKKRNELRKQLLNRRAAKKASEQ